jgi:hypothetical protein
MLKKPLISAFFIFAFIFIFAIPGSYAQNFLQKYSGIPFIIGGNQSQVPFNGGINNARTQFVDIDGDGLKDLFTFDVDTTLYFYKNTGTAQNPFYTLITTKFQNISFRNWFYFVNMDNDGDLDLFTGGELQVVKFYRNTGSAVNPVFSLEIAELHSSGDTTIISEGNSVPVFCDINNDGDIDFFSGTQIGAITFYENIGTSAAFNFKYITDLWEDILILSPADNERHGANVLEFADADGDNDFDLFFGDLFSKGIYFIKNNGTPSSPDMAIVDSTYPDSHPFLSLGFNAVRLNDMDNDGDKDMFVTVLYSSQTSGNFVLYKNEGSASNPNFQLTTTNYMTTVDAGDWSNMVFTDMDNDGKKDMIIGGSSNGYSGSPKLSYYKNTGTLTSPQYTLMQDSIPFRIGDFNFRYAPALADLDNDGDKDMLLGTFITDSLFFYRNTGTPASYNFTYEARGNQIGLVNAGQYSAPAFVDIDNDGDQDIFSGGSAGRINFYENTGTASNFNFVLRNNFYLNIDIGNESIPRFYDIDRDGDQDMFIGRQDGKITYYRNDGNASAPNFVLITNSYNNINVAVSSCPEFVDVDNDTDGDLFVGNIKGGMFYFENRDVVGITNISGAVPEAFALYQNYPNPFNPATSIKFDIPKSSHVVLRVYDPSGRLIKELLSQQLNAGAYEYSFKAENLSSGIYFYSLITGSGTQTKKMLLVK